jgi:hypothetical protein
MKRFTTLPILLVSFILLAGTHANAARGGGSGGGNFFFEETFVPIIRNSNDTTSFTDDPGVALESGSGFDFRTTLGYTIGGEFLVGLTYNNYSFASKRSAVSGGDDGSDIKTTKTEYGPTIGYLKNGWRALFTYFLSGTKQEDVKNIDSSGETVGDGTIKNTNGTGMQFSFGYTFALGTHFEIGPSLVYRSMTYPKQTKVNRLNASENYTDKELFTKNTESELSPMITMQFRF